MGIMVWGTPWGSEGTVRRVGTVDLDLYGLSSKCGTRRVAVV